MLLSYDEELYKAWLLKAEFRMFMKSNNSKEGREILNNWLGLAEYLNIPEFKDCLTAFKNWFEYILNSLDVTYTNGFIEGKNNKTKILAILRIENSSSAGSCRGTEKKLIENIILVGIAYTPTFATLGIFPNKSFLILFYAAQKPTTNTVAMAQIAANNT